MSWWVWPLCVVAAACSARATPCAHELEVHHWPEALAACSAELERTGAPDAGVSAAKAAFYLQRYDDVERLASPFVTTVRGADAHSLLGATALARGDLPRAIHHLRVATWGHVFAGDSRAHARDAQQLAGVWWSLGDYQAALAAQEEASAAAAIAAQEKSRTAASRASDDRLAFYIDLARADILRVLGEGAAAERSLDRAVAEAVGDDDKILGTLKQGLLYIDLDRPALGRLRLAAALHAELARLQPRQLIIESAWLNLSYLDRLANNLALALDEVEAAHRAGAEEWSYRLNRGLALADLGRLSEAIEDLAVAEAEHPIGRWSWWVPYQRGVITARAGDLTGAIAAYRRAIARIGELAALSGPRGATLVAAHRGPHEHLIGLLAANRAWREVLDVVAAMDVADVLDARDDHRTFSPGSVDRPARRSVRAVAGRADVAAILAAWRHQRLVVVVPGGARLWRLDVHDGAIDGVDAGDARHLGELAARLEADPGDLSAATELGTAIVPAGLGVGEELAVLAVGEVARAPLAVLRAGGARVIERSPVMRATGIVPRAREVMFDAARAISIGDPGDNLPAARGEARWVAQRFGAALYLGAAATRSALSAAAGASLLHVAAHSGISVLPLHDGEVSAYDPLVPVRLVVLASCSAAAGTDEAGHGSLALAFLDAGAETVIATPWSVGDGDARRLVEAFYARDGATPGHAARALARAQLALAAETSARAWAGFEVLIGRPRRAEDRAVGLGERRSPPR